MRHSWTTVRSPGGRACRTRRSHVMRCPDAATPRHDEDWRELEKNHEAHFRREMPSGSYCCMKIIVGIFPSMLGNTRPFSSRARVCMRLAPTCKIFFLESTDCPSRYVRRMRGDFWTMRRLWRVPRRYRRVCMIFTYIRAYRSPPGESGYAHSIRCDHCRAGRRLHLHARSESGGRRAGVARHIVISHADRA